MDGVLGSSRPPVRACPVTLVLSGTSRPPSFRETRCPLPFRDLVPGQPCHMVHHLIGSLSSTMARFIPHLRLVERPARVDRPDSGTYDPMGPCGFQEPSRSEGLKCLRTAATIRTPHGGVLRRETFLAFLPARSLAAHGLGTEAAVFPGFGRDQDRSISPGPPAAPTSTRSHDTNRNGSRTTSRRRAGHRGYMASGSIRSGVPRSPPWCRGRWKRLHATGPELGVAPGRRFPKRT